MKEQKKKKEGIKKKSPLKNQTLKTDRLKEKKKRKEMSFELFQVLTNCKHYGYRNIITGDQSWFIYNYAPEGAWVLEDEENPIFERSQLLIEKMMITVIWGVWGVYIVDQLPEGTHFNSEYFVEYI